MGYYLNLTVTYVPRSPTKSHLQRSCHVGWVPDIVNHAK